MCLHAASHGSVCPLHGWSFPAFIQAQRSQPKNLPLPSCKEPLWPNWLRRGTPSQAWPLVLAASPPPLLSYPLPPPLSLSLAWSREERDREGKADSHFPSLGVKNLNPKLGSISWPPTRTLPHHLHCPTASSLSTVGDASLNIYSIIVDIILIYINEFLQSNQTDCFPVT